MPEKKKSYTRKRTGAPEKRRRYNNKSSRTSRPQRGGNRPRKQKEKLCLSDQLYVSFLRKWIIGLSKPAFFITILFFTVIYSWFYYNDVPGVQHHEGMIMSKPFLFSLGISFVHLFAAYYVFGMLFAWVCFALGGRGPWLSFKRVGIFIGAYLYVLLVMVVMGVDKLLKSVDLIRGNTQVAAYAVKEFIWAYLAYKAARHIFHTKKGRSIIFFIILPLFFIFLEFIDHDAWQFAKKILYH